MQATDDYLASCPQPDKRAGLSGSGRDLVDVKVTIDGQPLTARLDGRPLAVDPGDHAFVFEVPGEAPVTQHFVLAESEKNRREAITIGKPSAVPATDRPSGNEAQNDCPNSARSNQRQAGDEHSSALTKATVSTIGFIAGGVLVAGGAGALLHGAETQRQSRRRISRPPLPLARRPLRLGSVLRHRHTTHSKKKMTREKWRARLAICVWPFIGAALLSACASVLGIGDLPEEQSSLDGSPDVAALDADPTVDGDALDASPLDAGRDASCKLTVLDGSAIANRSPTEKTLDGLDTDWGCDPIIELNSGNAAFTQIVHEDAGVVPVSGNCKFEWTPANLYIFCDIADPTPGGGTDSFLVANDALELFASGTPVSSRTQNYGALDHQYVCDWRGMKTEFRDSTQLASPAAFTPIVFAHPGGYSVESAIAATSLTGGGSLTASSPLTVDFGLDDGPNQSTRKRLHHSLRLIHHSNDPVARARHCESRCANLALCSLLS